MDSSIRAASTSRPLKVRNEVIREKWGNTILERMENNMLKWYGHVVRMEDSRWPKIIMYWALGGRRGRPEVKWGKEIERVMKQGNLT